MAKSRVSGPERLLHGIAKLEGDYPINKEGRVDIKNLTLMLMEITKDDGVYRVKEHDRQYLTKHEELRDHIAEENSRIYKAQDDNRNIDDLAAGRIAEVNKQAKSASEDAVRARADYAEVLQRLAQSEQRNGALTREIQSLQEQMELVRQGIMPQVK
jgi:chromosome segregation ATPase